MTDTNTTDDHADGDTDDDDLERHAGMPDDDTDEVLENGSVDHGYGNDDGDE